MNLDWMNPFFRPAALGLVCAMLMLSGCASDATSPVSPEPAHSVPTKSPNEKNDKGVTPTRLAQGEGALDDQADAYAQRLAAALELRNRPPEAAGKTEAGDRPQVEVRGIDWVDNTHLRTANPPRVENPAEAKTQPAAKEDVKPAEPPSTPADKPETKTDAAAAKPTTAAQAQSDRESLLKQIRERVTDSNDAAVHKAMSLAALAIVDPAFQLDEKELASLPPTQRELVRQFHDLFASLGAQVASGQAVDRHALGDRLNAIIGEQPLAIRNVKLCDRVRSFGVYEELSGTTFLAGREQPMVVYVELDHFKSVKTGEQHEVKLSQELVLYNDADGLAVWRQPEQQIVDESRNRRRDFYVVQPTRLPARLGVGKFVLKVRVRDLHGGTRDEVSIPINIVADPALVKPDVKRDGNGKAG